MFGSIDAQTGNLVDLAQYQFWGVMIAVLMVMPVMLWMILKFNNNSHVHMIDRLAIPIDGMKHSIDMLAQQLAAAMASLSGKVDGMASDVNELKDEVGDLKDEVGDLKGNVHGVAAAVKEHGTILEDHSVQLAGAKKPARKRGGK